MHPARPGFSATLTGRSPWRSVLRSGPDSRGGEPGGLAHRAGSPRRTRERTFTAAFCARADNDGSGRGILGSVHRVLARDRAPASLACGPGRSDAAAPRGSSPSWGTRVGPRFCLQTSLLGESCAPASPALAAAARPLRARRSWCVLSGDASSPGPRGEMLRGNRRPDGAFVPWPRCARRSQAALHRRPSQFGRRRGSDGVELTSLPAASSGFVPEPAQVDSESPSSCMLPSLEGRASPCGRWPIGARFSGTHAAPRSSCGAFLSQSSPDRVTHAC